MAESALIGRRRGLSAGTQERLAEWAFALPGVLALAGFGLARRFDLALALLWLIVVLRAIHGPLHATWFNQRIDNPQVRATLFSISSQVDSIGQVAGGPGVGAIGNASIRLALVASAAILSPAAMLYGLVARRSLATSRDETPS